MSNKENDLQFEKAEAIVRALRLIRKNASCGDIAAECGLDGRFVLALICLLAEEGL
ncbi:MAG TPA: hypothetical protein VMI10_09800 [Terriglobales bacterium]|nr:hypothetical protein [Terriglobales bacterium]